jgi:hypothetical protein
MFARDGRRIVERQLAVRNFAAEGKLRAIEARARGQRHSIRIGAPVSNSSP